MYWIIVFLLKTENKYDRIFPSLGVNMSVGMIVGIALGSLGVLGLLFVIFYFSVFRERIAKKQIRELDRRVQFSHALLIGQDIQYVKRLEIISRTNLLYVDVHTRFLKRFKEIRNKHDCDAEQGVNSLKDFIEDKNFSEYKQNLQQVTELVDRFEELVNTLSSDLLKVVKPEEDCRQSALTYKEQLRRIKQDYYSKESELLLMSSSFSEIFKYIDKRFEEFESLVESAQYDEANTILPEVDRILHEIVIHMNELPTLCTTISVVIPAKIASVEEAYNKMVDLKYPLYHLGVVQTIDGVRLALDEFTKKVRMFKVEGVADKLDEINVFLYKIKSG